SEEAVTVEQSDEEVFLQGKRGEGQVTKSLRVEAWRSGSDLHLRQTRARQSTEEPESHEEILRSLFPHEAAGGDAATSA
ncbi:hypothetical protein THAOC_14127, partial [Thalassiosira oceanica]